MELSPAAYLAILALVRVTQVGYRTRHELVDDLSTVDGVLEPVLADLIHGELLCLRDGAFRLARPADEISLLDAIETSEGPIAGEVAETGDDNLDDAIKEVCDLAARELRRLLADLSIDGLV